MKSMGALQANGTTFCRHRSTMNAFKHSAVMHTSCRSIVQCRTVNRPTVEKQTESKETSTRTDNGIAGLGDVLGPIGLTIGGPVTKAEPESSQQPVGHVKSDSGIGGLGDVLGPIGLTIGGTVQPAEERNGAGEPSLQSISTMTTEEWRAKYENEDGSVNLWVEEEFNSGSRLVGGRSAYHGDAAGFRSGEGPSAGAVPTHAVKILDHYSNQEICVEVPEDRYILYEAEAQGLELPMACRLGCCTACAVRVLEGEMYQPQALGISEELKRQGYALMCVGFPLTDLVLETVAEDEVYDLQFGRFFTELATDPSKPSVQRDDFALELAEYDE